MSNRGFIGDAIHTLTGGLLNSGVYDGSGKLSLRKKQARAAARKGKFIGPYSPQFYGKKSKTDKKQSINVINVRPKVPKRPRQRRQRFLPKLPSEIYAQPVPSMHSQKESVRVTHSEYISDIYSSAAANTINTNYYQVNPGTLGPWVNNMAVAYTEYKFKSLMYEFKSSASDYSGTPSVGQLAIGVQYDVNKPLIEDWQTMMEATGVQSGKVTQNILCAIECAPKAGNKTLNIRAGALPIGADLIDYDLARVTVASTGCPAQVGGINLGQLWVTYDIILMKPQTSYGVTESTAHYQLTGFDLTHFVGTEQEKKIDTIGLLFNDLNTITFPIGTRGNYKLSLDIVGSSETTEALITTLVNAVGINIYRNSTVSHIQIPATGASTVTHYELAFKIPDSSKTATITFTSGKVVPSSATSVDLFVEESNIDLKN